MSGNGFLPGRFAALVIAAGALASCSGAPSGTASRSAQAAYIPRVTGLAVPNAVTPPALLSIDATTHALEYWPIQKGGSESPRIIARNVASPGDMAADGQVIAVANQSGGLVRYDILKKTKTVLADSFGIPLTVAIGKDHSVYASNFVPRGTANIVVYRAGSATPREVTCGLFGLEGSVAVDDEGNIFYLGDFHDGSSGVIEISRDAPAGSCRDLHLNPDSGGFSGVAIDPKTDALLTLGTPDECAGGNEAELTIYPKPYSKTTATIVEMTANCSGGLRLNADSTMLFYGDQDVSGSFTFIRQATYPGGQKMGAYGGGAPSGFTTIPNTLPN